MLYVQFSQNATRIFTGDSSQDEAEEEATAVTVKFARPESDAAKARRLASFSHLQRKQEEESWLPLHYYNVYVGYDPIMSM
ncbi:hypothetical protein DPMN_025903 [Dreissena polymorpha]|uniref:Uncharacterized protein n=1 Tax=Dreissena polymorpha TaxID=45954 RepID=A0A9D4LQL3_DREPO|nr:hypothetical protein DPMN_025903 [Dreissena polymorpha]